MIGEIVIAVTAAAVSTAISQGNLAPWNGETAHDCQQQMITYFLASLDLVGVGGEFQKG